MRRWLGSAAAAARLVADRPALWLPGALAWAVTVGWIGLIAGVARPPSVADLTFLGAGIFTSGAWPWNALALGAGALLLPVLALALASVAEAALLERLHARRAPAGAILDLLAVGMILLLPVLIGVLVTGIALVLVAPAEFTSPDNGAGPVARTAARLSPFLVAVVLLAAAGAALHAAAARRIVRWGTGVLGGLAGSGGTLRSGGAASLVHAVVLLLLRAGSLVAATLLLRTLWTPISERLRVDGMDVATGLLLVGFVAIWLCIVLGGGALHAWSSATWSALLTGEMSQEPMETRSPSS